MFMKPCYYDIDDRVLLTEGKLLLSVAKNLSVKPKVVRVKLTDYQKMSAKQRMEFLENLGIKPKKA